MANYTRNKPGERFDFRGMDLLHPVDLIPGSKVAFAQNVRRYIQGAITGRNPLSSALMTLGAALHSLLRMNDYTPAGPSAGYTYIAGAATDLYVGTSGTPTPVATGLSGNPVSIIPFRPNTSVRPFGYIGDSAPAGSVTISTEYLISGDAVNFVTNGMVKVSSTGIIYKSGVKEPQSAPVIGTENTSVAFSGDLLATAIPWSNYEDANSDFDYGETDGYYNGTVPSQDGTQPFIVNVQNASTVTISSITGSATINGSTASPTSSGPATDVNTNPGHYIQEEGTGTTPPPTATVVIGAFTDGNGNVLSAGVAPLYRSSIFDVGANIGTAITIPSNAVSLQIGINSTGNTFSSNSGEFVIAGDVTTNALPTVLSVSGSLTCYYWGDSSTSSVANYYWKNPGDAGSGVSRTIGTAIGSSSNNSFIFDATFTNGIPELPGIGDEQVAMTWTTLNTDSVASGSIPVFPSPITTPYTGNTNYANFNFCLYGNIYIPQAGDYTFVLTHKDAVMWGLGADATLVSATVNNGSGPVLSTSGQTITVVNGYPLFPIAIENTGEGGGYGQTTVVVNYASAGIKPIEVDYDYWYHSGRILLIEASPTPNAAPTIIPPLTGSVKENVEYWYVYRSSATGAQSNPSPNSPLQSIPVLANTITSLWSDDPQIDLVDYYRQDSGLTNPTYVATGPNDNLGTGGTNTSITDSLSDLAAANNPIMATDNFEPFPSIDLPQKGVCNVSGGVITWVSGGAVGGTATGFNLRWLAGTVIEIGAPTSLAYTLVARPTSTTSMTIPGVPDGTNLTYVISEPILANQPLPYLAGPTDNINFTFGVGDDLRPGTLYWCSGSNLDSAPDTNQLDVTDPSEALVNVAISEGRGVLFSIFRAWMIMPNFYNAQATATGIAGNTWSLEETSITRGLYVPRCLAIEGGGNIFFRVNDGIHVSQGGGASKSITDDDIYPLFQHENEAPPAPIVRGATTIYPPDDTQPQLQKFLVIGNYLYYDYVGTDGNPHTLVYDFVAGGWVWDVYDPPATVRASNEDISVQGTWVGCSDGTVREMTTTGTETATAIVWTPAWDKGDTRAVAQWGDCYIEKTGN